jgi:hypothetical protein
MLLQPIIVWLMYKHVTDNLISTITLHLHYSGNYSENYIIQITVDDNALQSTNHYFACIVFQIRSIETDTNFC